MADKQEKKELGMEEDYPMFEIIPPGAIEKAWEMRGSKEWTPEEEERLTKFVKILEEDIERRRELLRKEKEQNK